MRISKINWKWMLVSAVLITTGLIVLAVDAQAQSQNLPADLPRYEVDPTWPKELPNNWILSNSTGLFVDENDHIWVLHRPRQVPMGNAGAAQRPPISECCIPAPSVLQFDKDGNLLKYWGGPGHVPDWPMLEHGLFIDRGKNVWIAGNFRGGGTLPESPIPPPATVLGDRHVLKLSTERIGRPSNEPTNNQDTSMLGSPSEVFVDDDANEVYIADGYQNSRVVVYDSNTGAFKRGWGAYGVPLRDIPNDRPPAHDTKAPTSTSSVR
jgi:hypothetical protein